MPVNPDYTPSDTVQRAYIDDEYSDRLIAYHNAIGQETRFKLLSGLLLGKSTAEITDDLNIERAGLTNHLKKPLKEAELVYQPGGKQSSYAVTPLGQYAVEQEQQNREDILNAYQALDDAEEQAIAASPIAPDRFDKAKEQGYIDEERFRAKIWETAWSDVQQELGIDETRFEP